MTVEKYEQNIRRSLSDKKTPLRLAGAMLFVWPLDQLIIMFSDYFAATGRINPAICFHRYLLGSPHMLFHTMIQTILVWIMTNFMVRYYIRTHPTPLPVQTIVPRTSGVWPPPPSNPLTGEPLPSPTSSPRL